MVRLGFDTATEDTSVCVSRDGEVLYEALLGLSNEGWPQHTTALLGEIERAVAAAGGWARIGDVAVGLGPGSFTGLRVAVATARGLALSRGIPVGGVCTLDALGRALGERAGPGQRLAVLDARRGEVFHALYSPRGERLQGPSVSTPEELAGSLGELDEAPLAAGSGAVRFRRQLAISGVAIPDDADPVHRIAARHVCALATPGGADSGSLAPIYLRPPDAERWRERDSRKNG